MRGKYGDSRKETIPSTSNAVKYSARASASTTRSRRTSRPNYPEEKSCRIATGMFLATPVPVYRSRILSRTTTTLSETLLETMLDGCGPSLEQKQPGGSVLPIVVHQSGGRCCRVESGRAVDLEAGGIAWAIKCRRGYHWSRHHVRPLFGPQGRTWNSIGEHTILQFNAC